MYQSKLTGAMISDEEYSNRLTLLWIAQWNSNVGQIVKQYKSEKKTLKDYIELMKKTYKDLEYEKVRQYRCYD